MWCSDPSTHVVSFGFVSGFGHGVCTTHSVSLCECVVSFAQPRALLSTCVVFCVVARSLCFYRLRAFMPCLV